MNAPFAKGERFGILRTGAGARPFGIEMVGGLLRSCAIRVVEAEGDFKESATALEVWAGERKVADWARGERLSALGFGCQLDAAEEIRLFSALLDALRASGLVGGGAAPLKALYFAGLPAACDGIIARFPFVAGVFRGDESPARCLELLGLGDTRLPGTISSDLAYDEGRLAFGRELVAKGGWEAVSPVDRSGYPRFGLRGDGLVARIAQGNRKGHPPLMSAGMGAWLPDRREAVGLFEEWTSAMARGGLLDVLSIDNSRLSRSAFGEDWEGRPDGDGVPLDSPEAFGRIWELARPMLVRSRSGAGDVAEMARMLDERIDMAWHALSFWWTCGLDGTGNRGVLDNLRRHFEALDFVVASGKPFEPDVPHHFAIRGADDTSYVVSGWLAARAAKERGVRDLVLPVELNTPKYTWGVNDLAKARALLQLVRELEDGDFRVHPYPRSGAESFSPERTTALAQAAAMAALMDDIEPWDLRSPEMIQVVAMPDGPGFADPSAIEGSIRIMRAALSEWRSLRAGGLVDDMSRNGTVLGRTSELIAEARSTIASICASIPDPFGPEGMYRILSSGFLAMPWLSELRDEFPEAVRWRTQLMDGAVKVVDGEGIVVPAELRLPVAAELARAGGVGRPWLR